MIRQSEKKNLCCTSSEIRRHLIKLSGEEDTIFDDQTFDLDSIIKSVKDPVDGKIKKVKKLEDGESGYTVETDYKKRGLRRGLHIYCQGTGPARKYCGKELHDPCKGKTCGAGTSKKLFRLQWRRQQQFIIFCTRTGTFLQQRQNLCRRIFCIPFSRIRSVPHGSAGHGRVLLL